MEVAMPNDIKNSSKRRIGKCGTFEEWAAKEFGPRPTHNAELGRWQNAMCAAALGWTAALSHRVSEEPDDIEVSALQLLREARSWVKNR